MALLAVAEYARPSRAFQARVTFFEEHQDLADLRENLQQGPQKGPLLIESFVGVRAETT
jgi:hypothetical protein